MLFSIQIEKLLRFLNLDCMSSMLRRRYVPKQYLVLKIEGLEFVRTWFNRREHVPPSLTKLYQLLLHIITMNGTIQVQLALRSGYTRKIISDVVKKGYVVLSPTPRKPVEEVRVQINDIIGEPPQGMFV